MNHERIGKYRIVGELGRGTMGEVHKAHDPVLNRYVALKTLAVHFGPSDEALERFQREAQAAALLNHPNIVTIHDFGQEHGLLYMAMELLEGGTDLRDAIDNDLLQSLELKLDVLDGVLAGLDYAHAKGVVHRDIKPANIHLGADGQVKLIDFGLARVSTSEWTQEGIVLGTPNYMSPEQALGDRVDGRSDLFSTGAVMYELLTGHKPFEADSTPSVLFQVVHKAPPPVRRWAPDTPAALVAVVERALQKDRERRFQGAAEMRGALAAARPSLNAPPVRQPPPLPPRPSRAEGSPGSGSASGMRLPGAPPLPPRSRTPTPAPAPASPRLPRPARRALLGGAGLALLLLAAVAVGVWLRRGARPDPAPAASPAAANEQVGALTQALVATQVQLAQRELDDKNYTAAAQQARSALKLSPNHAAAASLLGEARERLDELEAAVARARALVAQGDTATAAQQLSRVLELDPRHPAAAELSARLNSAFQAQAEAAASLMRAARSDAAAAGAANGPEFAVGTERVRAAVALAENGGYADATRAFLEARDAFDRVRRAARGAPAAPRASAAPTAAATGTPPADTAATRPAGAATPAAPALAAGATPAPAEPAPLRHFETEETLVGTPPAGGLPGFESQDVRTRRTPEFSGRLVFDVLPASVRAGDAFVVRLQVVNDSRRALRVRSIALVTVADGRRTPAAAKTIQRELAPKSTTLLAEYSDVWRDVSSWTLEAVVTSERNETISSRLRSR